MDPRGFPTTLPEFQRVFPDDRACATYLEREEASKEGNLSSDSGSLVGFSSWEEVIAYAVVYAPLYYKQHPANTASQIFSVSHKMSHLSPGTYLVLDQTIQITDRSLIVIDADASCVSCFFRPSIYPHDVLVFAKLSKLKGKK